MFIVSPNGECTRLLHSRGTPYKIEVVLTPVDDCWSSVRNSWSSVRQERLMATKMDEPIESVQEIPDHILTKMLHHLGDELTQRLIHHDYLTEVTALDILFANRESVGGVVDGVPLADIKARKKMTPQMAVERLKELRGPDEDSHVEADSILCELLAALGCSDAVYEFDRLGKWYA